MNIRSMMVKEVREEEEGVHKCFLEDTRKIISGTGFICGKKDKDASEMYLLASVEMNHREQRGIGCLDGKSHH